MPLRLDEKSLLWPASSMAASSSAGCDGVPYSNATVDDALGLMRQLRERGVRSHFWV